MKLSPNKPYREMTQDERNLYMANCRLAERNGLLYLLFTYGLGSLYRDMTEGGKPFAVLSASKAAWPDIAHRSAVFQEDETRRRNSMCAGEIRTELKDLGLGYLPAWGVWTREESESPDEFMVFAPGLTQDKAIELGRKYEQDHVVVGIGGGDYWTIDVNSGKRTGPFPASARLKRLVLERLLQREEERILLNSEARTLPPRPGYRRFWFWRSGGGFITTHNRPFGFDLHRDIPGPELVGDFKAWLMDTETVDAYLPL